MSVTRDSRDKTFCRRRCAYGGMSDISRSLLDMMVVSGLSRIVCRCGSFGTKFGMNDKLTEIVKATSCFVFVFVNREIQKLAL